MERVCVRTLPVVECIEARAHPPSGLEYDDDVLMWPLKAGIPCRLELLLPDFFLFSNQIKNGNVGHNPWENALFFFFTTGDVHL